MHFLPFHRVKYQFMAFMYAYQPKMNRSKLKRELASTGVETRGHNCGVLKHHNIKLCNITKHNDCFSAPYKV